MAHNRELSQFANTIGYNGGKIGIGTDNPTEMMSITNAGGTGSQMQFRDTSTGGADADGFRVGYNGSGGQCWNFENTYFRIATSNTERLRIDSAGQVRIANTTITTSSSADDLIVGTTSSNRGITIFSSTDGTGNIFFGDTDTSGTGNRMGTITYDHSENYMRFSTNGNNERLRITSAGKVLINSTANSNATMVVRSLTDNTHPVIKFKGTSANGYTFFGDDYQTDESQFTMGFAYSASSIVIGWGVKVSTSANNVYLSSQDTYATKHSAIRHDNNGWAFLSNSSTQTVTTDSAVTLTERLRITSDGKVGINDTNPAYSLSIAGTGAVRNEIVCTDNNGAGAGVYFRTMNGGSMVSNATIRTDNVGNLQFYSGTSSDAERLRITSDGHKFTNNGSIFHGSSDVTDFTDASRDSLNRVSLRAGHQSDGTTPTNDNSAVKIYPAGVRSSTTGNLTGGIAWQHLDPNYGDWGTNFGAGAQIWMGAALHDTPGQERDRFNLWMNSQTSHNAQPNNLAIEAYPNGVVRHPKVPAFHATGGTTLVNSTYTVIVSGSTEFNNGSHYDTSNGRFTAPVAGYYQFSFWGLIYPHASGVMTIRYQKNGSLYADVVQGGADGQSHTSRSGTIIMPMVDGDYAELTINRGSTSGVNAYGSQWNMCGFLVG